MENLQKTIANVQGKSLAFKQDVAKRYAQPGSYGKAETRHVQDHYEGHNYMDGTVEEQPHFNIHQEKTGPKIPNENKHYPYEK